MIYEHDGATLSLQLDPRLLLSVVDSIMAEPALDCLIHLNPDWHKDTRNHPWRFTRWSWIAEISGLELGVEITDYTFWQDVPATVSDTCVSNTKVARRESSLVERQHRLIGTDWTLEFRFRPHHHTYGDCLFSGQTGYLLEPIVRGSLDGWRREMTMLKLVHDTTRRYGASAHYPRFPLGMWDGFKQCTLIDAWYAA